MGHKRNITEVEPLGDSTAEMNKKQSRNRVNSIMKSSTLGGLSEKEMHKDMVIRDKNLNNLLASTIRVSHQKSQIRLY